MTSEVNRMDNDGVIEKVHTQGTFERIELRLNSYGLSQALIKAGVVPEGFFIEFSSFDESDSSILELSLKKETPGTSLR